MTKKVGASDKNLATGGIIFPHQERSERGLAAARRAHQRHAMTHQDDQINAMQRVVVAWF
jgi:hypothetical protein